MNQWKQSPCWHLSNQITATQSTHTYIRPLPSKRNACGSNRGSNVCGLINSLDISRTFYLKTSSYRYLKWTSISETKITNSILLHIYFTTWHVPNSFSTSDENETSFGMDDDGYLRTWSQVQNYFNKWVMYKQIKAIQNNDMYMKKKPEL